MEGGKITNKNQDYRTAGIGVNMLLRGIAKLLPPVDDEAMETETTSVCLDISFSAFKVAREQAEVLSTTVEEHLSGLVVEALSLHALAAIGSCSLNATSPRDARLRGL